MPEYRVGYRETAYYVVHLEADSEDEARRIVESNDLPVDADPSWDMSENTEVTFVEEWS